MLDADDADYGDDDMVMVVIMVMMMMMVVVMMVMIVGAVRRQVRRGVRWAAGECLHFPLTTMM